MLKFDVNSLKQRLHLTVLLSIVFILTSISATYYSDWLSIKKDVYDSFDSLSTQMETQLQNNLHGIGELAKEIAFTDYVQTYLFTQDPVECIEAMDRAFDTVERIKERGDNIHSIFLLTRTPRHLYTNPSDRKLLAMLNSAREQYGLLSDISLKKPFYSKFFYLPDEITGELNPYFFYFMPVYNIKPGEMSKVNQGLCVICCDMQSLVNAITMENTASAIVATYMDEPVASTRTLTQAETAALPKISGWNEQNIQGVRYLTSVALTPELDWKIVALTPVQAIMREALAVRNTRLGLLVLGGAALYAFIFWITHSVTQPVNEMVSELLQIDSSSLQQRIKMPKLSEIRVLAGSINDMLARIESMTQKEIAAQQRLFQAVVAQKQAELMFYRSQINPHFLFNAFETICGMAQYSGVPDLEEATYALSGLFRYAMNAKTNVTVAEEVENAASYFSVMSIRWPGRFRLSTCIDLDIAQRLIPSMLLQPLAENAFKHGFKDKKKTGRLSIQGRLKDGYIFIKVTDNGEGISAERLRELNEGMVCPDKSLMRIGLINIAHRLRLLYDGRASIRIDAKLHRYTSVVISIPADALPEISLSGPAFDTAPV